MRSDLGLGGRIGVRRQSTATCLEACETGVSGANAVASMSTYTLLYKMRSISELV